MCRRLGRPRTSKGVDHAEIPGFAALGRFRIAHGHRDDQLVLLSIQRLDDRLPLRRSPRLACSLLRLGSGEHPRRRMLGGHPHMVFATEAE